MIEAGRHGAISWVDLATPDVEQAAAFYGDLLGWTIERSRTEMGEYLVAKVGEHDVAGMMTMSPEQAEMPPMWSTYVSVDDVDTTLGVVSRAGGRVLAPPFDIPGGARVAVVADPTGAMLCLITGPTTEQAFTSPLPGAVCWVELLTRDLEAAEAFYNEVFGWKAFRDGPGEYTMLRLDDEDVAGMMMMPDMVPAEAPAHWSVYFSVADCAAAERKVAALGGTVLRQTTDIAPGKFAVLADPQGATFEVMELIG